MFQRRHYRELARIFKEIGYEVTDFEVFEDIVSAFTAELIKGNDKFNMAIWLDAIYEDE